MSFDGKKHFRGGPANNARVFGFVAERLLDVWIETNGYAYRDLPVVNMESQHWIRKGSAFIKRKLTYKRHEK